MENIACYCRVSTLKESQVDSFENQKAFFVEYAQKNNCNLVNIYADEGITGTKLRNRNQFKKMIKDAELGIFSKVIVKDVSRFARNTVDLLQNVRKLKALNINVNFITSDMNTLGESEFILTIFGALAQEESANMSKRVKFAKKINAEKGRVPNFVYGYDKIQGDYFNLNINPQESEVVKEIFDMYVNKRFGSAKISFELNKRNLKTKRGCQWSQNAISRILTNQIYIGNVINGKQEVVDFLTGKRVENSKDDWSVVHKPELAIISESDFQQAQAIIAENYQKFNLGQKRQSTKLLFSSLIKCKCCGYTFRKTEYTYVNTHTRWICSGRNRYGTSSCNNKTKIDGTELLSAIQEYVINIFQNKNDIVKRILDEDKKYNQKNNINKNTLEKRITSLSKQKDKLMQMFNNDVINIDELKDKIAPINSEINKLQIDVKLIENNNSGINEKAINNMFDIINTFIVSNVEDYNNELLKSFIDIIEVDEHGNVDIKLKMFM